MLDEIIKARKARAIAYEAYLQQIASLAAKVQAGQGEDTPTSLDTPGKRALFGMLGQDEALALRIDDAVKRTRPDGWRGVLAREQIVKKALYEVLQDVAEVERVFAVIKAQTEY